MSFIDAIFFLQWEIISIAFSPNARSLGKPKETQPHKRPVSRFSQFVLDELFSPLRRLPVEVDQTFYTI